MSRPLPHRPIVFGISPAAVEIEPEPEPEVVDDAKAETEEIGLAVAKPDVAIGLAVALPKPSSE